MVEQNKNLNVDSNIDVIDSKENSSKIFIVFKTIIRALLDLLRTLLVSFLIAWFITTFIIANSVVPTGSMESTIMTGTRVVGDRLCYKFWDEPERGDIIIFHSPDDYSIYFVKRLIGLPGDVVEIKKDSSDSNFGGVYINGERLNEPYLKEPMEVWEEMRFEIPSEGYFFMGDNRNYSNDARFWDTHYIKRDKLVAKVLFQYWKGFKWLDN